MSDVDFDPDEFEEVDVVEDDRDETLDVGKRRFLLIMQLGLLAGIAFVGFIFVRYVINPAPLAEILPIIQPIGGRCPTPSYRLLIDNIDKPMGVAVSPDSQRIYVSETGGEKMIKMFDRDGNFITQFAPIGTDMYSRSYVYLAVEPASGRLFAVNRESNSIDVFDKDGNYIDSIIRSDMTISKLLLQNGVGLQGLEITRFDFVNNMVLYQVSGGPTQKLRFQLEASEQFTPLGLRFDMNGDLIMSDVTPGMHGVAVIPAEALKDLSAFAPSITRIGKQGSEKLEFYFPQTALKTSKGEIVTSDGNNARMTRWNAELNSASIFGYGANQGSLGLPRGIWLDKNDCLLVVDRLNSVVNIYDLSEVEPKFVTTFGDIGVTEGKFNYPTDIAIDGTGRLYITDMNNNRVQVWSY